MAMIKFDRATDLQIQIARMAVLENNKSRTLPDGQVDIEKCNGGEIFIIIYIFASWCSGAGSWYHSSWKTWTVCLAVNTRAPIQYKDVILPVQEIPLWR